MKHFLKVSQIIVIAVIIAFTNLSTNKSNWSSINLTPDEMEHSVKFQLARGGNCKGEFEKLIPVLERFIKKSYDAEKITNILGTANTIKQENKSTKLIYNLSTSSNTCLLVLTVQDDVLVDFTTLSCK
ncbi:MAG: hypothetical protein ACOVO1_04970 [Chitinophagaceae bacterium]